MIVGNPISTGVGDAIYVLTIITAPGANVSAVLGDQTIATTANGSGVAVLRFKKEGTWTITATDGVNTKTITMEVTARRAETIKFFPAEPTEYVLIETYATSQTWTAPEDGYFQIEVFGASGNGGSSQKGCTYNPNTWDWHCMHGTGGGGGGGGYACSRIKMNKGDTIVLVPAVVGSTSSATINSSLESYSALSVTSGKNGGNGTARLDDYEAYANAGSGGAGGVASGGNVANINGGAGSKGDSWYPRNNFYDCGTLSGGAGGSAAVAGGNAGAKGANTKSNYPSTYPGILTYSSPSGSVGFIKIYRGDTNTVGSGNGGETSSSFVLYQTGMTPATSESNKWQFENAEFYTSNGTVLNGSEPATYDSTNGIVLDAASIDYTNTNNTTQWVALALHDNVDLTGPLTTYSTLNFDIQNYSGYSGPAVYLTDDMTKWNSGTKLATIENSTILSIPTADIQTVKYILIVGYFIDDTKAYISRIWFE